MTWWTNNRVQPKNKSKFVVVFGGLFYLPNIKSLNKPKIDFETKEFRLLNHKFNYPGNGTWQPITMKFVDMNGLGHQYSVFDTGAFLWQIMNNTGYTYPYIDNSQFRDPHFRNVGTSGNNIGREIGGGHHISTRINFRDNPDTELEEHDTWKTITTPEKSSTIANSFGLGLEGFADFENASVSKQRISIYQLDDGDGISECWHLVNPIVKSIGWGDLDYSIDDPVEYELQVIYDWAIMDRTQLGKKLTIDEIPYKNFMKTVTKENEEIIFKERDRAVSEAIPQINERPGDAEGNAALQANIENFKPPITPAGSGGLGAGGGGLGGGGSADSLPSISTKPNKKRQGIPRGGRSKADPTPPVTAERATGYSSLDSENEESRQERLERARKKAGL